MVEISVIVPVFNVEAYVARCLDSLLAQTFTEIEILVVDDGSTDRSGSICDGYAHADNRMRVFHIPNGGVSNARNFAMQKARGRYLAFVDSDDYVAPDMLERLWNCMQRDKRIQCVIGNAVVEEESGAFIQDNTEALAVEKMLIGDERMQAMLVNPALWNKLYDRSIIEQHGLQFDPRLAIAEDMVFFLTYLQYCKAIVYMGGKPIYHYVQHAQSVMQKKNCEKNRSVIWAFEEILCIYRQQGWEDMCRAELEYLAVAHLYIAAMVRVIRADRRHPLTTEIQQYMKTHFPQYRKNAYLPRLGRNKKLILFLVAHRFYTVVQFLFWLKGKRGK